MPRAKFSQYYKDGMYKLLDYLDAKQCLALRVDSMEGSTIIVTIGVSDGHDFILEFGTLALDVGCLVHVKSDNIYVDMHKMIKMEYNSDEPMGNDNFLMLERVIGG